MGSRVRPTFLMARGYEDMPPHCWCVALWPVAAVPTLSYLASAAGNAAVNLVKEREADCVTGWHHVALQCAAACAGANHIDWRRIHHLNSSHSTSTNHLSHHTIPPVPTPSLYAIHTSCPPQPPHPTTQASPTSPAPHPASAASRPTAPTPLNHPAAAGRVGGGRRR